jgi:bile acid:Na+ symporter, BASS family
LLAIPLATRLAIVLKAAISVLIFASGLSCGLEDVTWIWRRPGLLLRSVLAMYVVVPLVALAMVLLLDLPWNVEAALLFLSISAGAPLVPKKLLKLGGDPSFAFSLLITTSLLAIVTVPLSLAALGRFVPGDAQVAPMAVAATILKSFLLPLGAGMAVRALAPALTERMGDPLMRLGGLAIAGCALVLIVVGWRRFVDAGLPALLAFAALTLAALAVGHLLGGPDPGQRTALAVACASRHVGLALLVAAHVRGQRALTLVAGYMLAAALASAPYLRWRRRVSSTALRHS